MDCSPPATWRFNHPGSASSSASAGRNLRVTKEVAILESRKGGEAPKVEEFQGSGGLLVDDSTGFSPCGGGGSKEDLVVLQVQIALLNAPRLRKFLNCQIEKDMRLFEGEQVRGAVKRDLEAYAYCEHDMSVAATEEYKFNNNREKKKRKKEKEENTYQQGKD